MVFCYNASNEPSQWLICFSPAVNQEPLCQMYSDSLVSIWRAPPIFSGGKGLLIVLSTLNREYLPMHLAHPVSPPSVLDPSKGSVAGFVHGQESPESNNPLPNPLTSTAFFQVPLKVKKGFEQLLEKFLLLKALERQLIHSSTVFAGSQSRTWAWDGWVPLGICRLISSCLQSYKDPKKEEIRVCQGNFEENYDGSVYEDSW